MNLHTVYFLCLSVIKVQPLTVQIVTVVVVQHFYEVVVKYDLQS